jgi:hypothetical protein
MKRIQKFIYLLVIYILIASCNTSHSYDSRLESEIYKRIEILEKSYKFSVIPVNLQVHNFDSLKNQIAIILKKNSKSLVERNYDNIDYLFKKYEISINQYSDNKNVILLNILIGLDNLIFKYIPSRFNFSDFKTIVVPNKTELKLRDTLEARIYLTVSDSLYEPEIKYINNEKIYNLPCEHGIGQYKMIAHKKGVKKINGQMIYSNEFGKQDTIDWYYEFEVK